MQGSGPNGRDMLSPSIWPIKIGNVSHFVPQFVRPGIADDVGDLIVHIIAEGARLWGDGAALDLAAVPGTRQAMCRRGERRPVMVGSLLPKEILARAVGQTDWPDRLSAVGRTFVSAL